MILSWQSCTHWRKLILWGRLLCTQLRKTCWVSDSCARTDEILSWRHDLRACYFRFLHSVHDGGHVRTEELDSYIHCVNGLGQNADCYMNWHGMDSLIGALGNSHLYRVSQNKCTSIASIIFMRLKAHITLYTHPSVCNFLCVQLLLQFPSKLDLFGTCHNGIQSFQHPVILAPSQFDPYFGHFNTQFFFFFFAKNGRFHPVHFPRHEYWAKKKCVVVNISILFFCSK